MAGDDCFEFETQH